MQTYLVGGAVRDELLGLSVQDHDWVVVGATPEDMQKQGFKQVGADFPVFLHPKTREEYALARTERKQGHGYHGFSVYSAPDVTLEEDLTRRDLTINAMAKSESGELIDPFGGRQDIENRQLRHVSEAFAEDPLRILRVARFAARFQPLGFLVCEETMNLMRTMTDNGEVNHLVSERVWQETQRALHEKEPGTYFSVLHGCGALAVLVPELADPRYLEPALAALRCVHKHCGSTEERFAALMSPLASSTCVARAQALKVPNESRELARLTTQFLSDITEAASERVTADTLLSLLDIADYWRRPDRFAALLRVLDCTLGDTAARNLPATGLPVTDLLARAATAASGVEARALIADGFTGKELGRAIHQQRLQRIQQVLANHPE
jgi:tRNA nucleotidyltransferase (CCA-adding enzyme)